MRKAATAAVCVLCAAVCGAQLTVESPEAVTKATIKAMKDMTALLAKVKDGASAKKETAAIDTMGDSLAKAYIKFGEMAQNAKDEDIKDETKREMDTVETKLDEEINRMTGDGKISAAMGDLAERIKTFRK
jgi:transcription initiation factor TFIIIB Brf1 subunit/transcription initiation factor TFIIB